MKNFLHTSGFIFLISFCIASCTKINSFNNSIPNPNPNPNPNPVKIDTPPNIKFYSCLQADKLEVNLNNKLVTSVAQYYASGYIGAKAGTNYVSINHPGKASSLNANLDLLNNSNYSCFFYKVGNEWKYDLVRDDLSSKPNAGYAHVRILDYRTEAYYNYINVRMTGAGSSGFFIDQKSRNFLDHRTYSSYTNFQPVVSGNYNVYFYNDTMTASRTLNIPIDSKGIYTIMMNTPGNIASPYTDALKSIFAYAVKHN